MFPKRLIALALAATMALAPVGGVASDAGHALLGGVIGGVVGGVIVNEANKNKPPRRTTTTTTVVHPKVETATRAANRETQTALNYFGYNAGAADGILGRKSRRAVSGMQAYLNLPVTGRLTPFERDILMAAYYRGTSGNFDAMQLINNSPDGTRALLVAQRDIMTGNTTPVRTTGYAGLPIEVSDAIDEIADSSDPSAEQLLQRSGFIQLADMNGDGNNDYILDTSFSGSSFWCNATQCKSLVFMSTPQGYARNDLLAFDPSPASFSCTGSICTVNQTVLAATTPTVEAMPSTTTETAAPSLGTLGTLPTFGTPPASMAAYCNKVAMASGLSGMVVEAAAITDPELVLDQQFCVARQSAMDDETRMIGQLGVTLAQVDAQCAQYGDALKPYVASLAQKPRPEMMADMAAFVDDAGIDRAQLNTTAKICLGAGYRLDNADIALGSGLLLVQLGERPYGELMGHHLQSGLGVGARPALASAWFDDSLEAIASGAPAVFAPDDFGRATLISAALATMSGGSQTELMPLVPATGSKAKLSTLGSSAKKSK